jgi:hypothetical protein
VAPIQEVVPDISLITDHPTKEQINSVAYSQQANYTDQVAATGRRIFVPIFADTRLTRGQCDGSSRTLILISGPETHFSCKQLLSYPHKAERTSFHNHYLSENMVEPGIEPETSGSTQRTPTISMPSLCRCCCCRQDLCTLTCNFMGNNTIQPMLHFLAILTNVVGVPIEARGFG